ncbi:hypothetical protein RF11_13288 [Thelohanellus kitauei]|uniref:Uncharacterized protein n=1 Tax=Thelohanellus kitauei TaxID=669202 RepID=A0A0C2MB59_THEKT|nr:hypothetical protein RF11_13288 [Thelohanellus kitauei]
MQHRKEEPHASQDKVFFGTNRGKWVHVDTEKAFLCNNEQLSDILIEILGLEELSNIYDGHSDGVARDADIRTDGSKDFPDTCRDKSFPCKNYALKHIDQWIRYLVKGSRDVQIDDSGRVDMGLKTALVIQAQHVHSRPWMLFSMVVMPTTNTIRLDIILYPTFRHVIRKNSPACLQFECRKPGPFPVDNRDRGAYCMLMAWCSKASYHRFQFGSSLVHDRRGFFHDMSVATSKIDEISAVWEEFGHETYHISLEDSVVFNISLTFVFSWGRLASCPKARGSVSQMLVAQSVWVELEKFNILLPRRLRIPDENRLLIEWTRLGLEVCDQKRIWVSLLEESKGRSGSVDLLCGVSSMLWGIVNSFTTASMSTSRDSVLYKEFPNTTENNSLPSCVEHNLAHDTRVCNIPGPMVPQIIRQLCYGSIKRDFDRSLLSEWSRSMFYRVWTCPLAVWVESRLRIRNLFGEHRSQPFQMQAP